jgi:salicylate biosynthesis isochorismate synthase
MIPQPRARRRHEKILDAALRVFAKKGYRDAAVDDIAVESRTSKGGVYFHFPGKQAIFLELLNRTARRLREKIEEAIESETDPIQRADAALLVVLRTFASHRALARLFMIEALGAGKEFHQRLAEIHAEFASIIEEQLDEAVRQGVIKPLDTRVAATAWFGALNEVVTRWLLTDRPERLQDAYDALRPLLIRSVGVVEPARPAVFEDVLRSRLRSVVERAAERARDQGQPVLAAVSVECEPVNAVEIFRAGAAERTAVWLQPAAGFAAASLGAAARVPLRGPERFDIARYERRSLLDNAVVDAGTAPIEAPVCFARFTFAPAAGVDEEDGELVVPELLWISRGGDSWLTVCAVVPPDADVDAIVSSVESKVAASRPESPLAGTVPREAPCLVDAKDRQAWQGAVVQAVSAIKSGRLQKVVLARAVTVKASTAIDVGAALERLRERYRTCTVFAFRDEYGCFFGATPERLLRVQDGVVTVDCLAGSIGRGDGETDDRARASSLLHNPKELHEHQVVASAIEEALAPLCVDLQFAAAPRIATFPNVHHLYTPINGIALPGHDVLEFVERLHPTPATGGQPRDEAVRLIAKLETFHRGYYAGPLGWLDAAGNGDFAVAIRSGFARGDEATLYAGCGIVAESDPASEYEESNVKLKAMLWALGQE